MIAESEFGPQSTRNDTEKNGGRTSGALGNCRIPRAKKTPAGGACYLILAGVAGGRTRMPTAAVPEKSVPSETRYENASAPEKVERGV